MPTLNKTGYKVLKLAHIIFISIWIGAGVCTLFFLTIALDANNCLGIIKAVQRLDLLIIIPANALALISGIIFSIFTNWRFFKHRWIIAKYLINLIPLIFGGFLFAPPLSSMIAVAQKLGTNALSSMDFIQSKMIFLALLFIQLVLLLTAVYLSIFKPRIGRKA
jgi:hypothetical protein